MEKCNGFMGLLGAVTTVFVLVVVGS
jgi:hypothetical protein